MIRHTRLDNKRMVSLLVVQQWAKEHPELARRMIQVPPFPPTNNHSSSYTSLAEYLRCRQWWNNTRQEEERIMAMTLVSHVLTFPLTIASHLHRFLGRDENKLRLCCVGARSEATLPSQYWKEMLYFFATSTTHPHGTRNVELVIDFVGPDIPPCTVSQSIQYYDTNQKEENDINGTEHEDSIRGGKTRVGITLTMHYYKTHLHRYVCVDDTNVSCLWDGFVLFNPGLGHVHLVTDWHPTLRYILGTKKAILLTAHSEWDAKRDGRTLMTHGEHHRIVRYARNPFASQTEYKDPFAERPNVSWVRPNHSVLFLPSSS